MAKKRKEQDKLRLSFNDADEGINDEGAQEHSPRDSKKNTAQSNPVSLRKTDGI